MKLGTRANAFEVQSNEGMKKQIEKVKCIDIIASTAGEAEVKKKTWKIKENKVNIDSYFISDLLDHRFVLVLCCQIEKYYSFSGKNV